MIGGTSLKFSWRGGGTWKLVEQHDLILSQA